MMLGLLQNQQKPATDSKLIDAFKLDESPTSVEDGLIKVRELWTVTDVAKAIGDGVARDGGEQFLQLNSIVPATTARLHGGCT